MGAGLKRTCNDRKRLIHVNTGAEFSCLYHWDVAGMVVVLTTSFFYSNMDPKTLFCNPLAPLYECLCIYLYIPDPGIKKFNGTVPCGVSQDCQHYCPTCKKISLQSFMLIFMELLVNSVSLEKEQVHHITNNDISCLRLDEISGEGSLQAEIENVQERARTILTYGDSPKHCPRSLPLL